MGYSNKIDWTKAVSTDKGLPVRVLAIDSNLDYPVVGLVNGKPCSWKQDGSPSKGSPNVMQTELPDVFYVTICQDSVTKSLTKDVTLPPDVIAVIDVRPKEGFYSIMPLKGSNSPSKALHCDSITNIPPREDKPSNTPLNDSKGDLSIPPRRNPTEPIPSDNLVGEFMKTQGVSKSRGKV